MKISLQGATSDAELVATSQLVRVAIWGQALGYLLFALTDLTMDPAGFLEKDDLASLALPVAALLLMHITRFDIVLARAVGLGFLCFMVLLSSLAAAALPMLGAWFLWSPVDRFQFEGDLLTTNFLLTIGLFYSGALLLNIYYVLLAWRAASSMAERPLESPGRLASEE